MTTQTTTSEMSSSLDHYLRDRYCNQRDWYSSKAAVNKRWRLGCVVATAALSLLVTVTVALGMMNGDASSAWYIVSLVSSAAVAALTGLQNAFRFHENWIEYRTTSEQLKKERVYYDYRCGPYSTAKSADKLFVERIEALISRQNTLWTAGTLNRDEDSGTPKESTLPAPEQIG